MPENEREHETLDRAHLVSEVLPGVISAFKQLDRDGRITLHRTISALFGLNDTDVTPSQIRSKEVEVYNDRFSKERELTPKEFILKKQPRTDVERVACLAYFLSEYLGQKHFKTLDISKLNTEAAQVKFSNAAMAVDNATKTGYLAPAVKGNKQMSAAGELFVQALPDREAAKEAMSTARPRRKVKKAVRPRIGKTSE